MKYPLFLTSLILILFIHSGSLSARNIEIIAPGGDVHMRGRLIMGACVISASSQDLHVDMGQYTTHIFERTGDLSAPGIPFTLRLTDCNPEMVEGVGITFSGETAPKEPDVFRVTVSDARPTGISGGDGYSGLGLLITDVTGNQIIPNVPPEVFYRPDNSEISLHYIARYRSTSRGVYPGELHSDVRFDIAYP
ncbi:fimbrial protein (plasmid) [Serratia marcescens]|nr:fimbrial protein [Serratia marcescens]